MKLCDRCRVPGCLLDYGGKACQEARKKYCPDVVFTHADKIREMDDEELAFIIMCPRDDGNKCTNCGDVITCIACCLDWLRESAEGVSMAQIVTAQFVGQTSCGFVSKKYYEIEISAGRSGCLCVRDVQGQGFCPYSTLAALRRNWKIIDNEKTPGGEPGRNEAGYERGYFDPR